MLIDQGVLFLDELPECSSGRCSRRSASRSRKAALAIVGAGRAMIFLARFQLVAEMFKALRRIAAGMPDLPRPKVAVPA